MHWKRSSSVHIQSRENSVLRLVSSHRKQELEATLRRGGARDTMGAGNPIWLCPRRTNDLLRA